MHSATLLIHLPALRENYRTLVSLHAKKNIAAVVKANAYGLGAESVSKALWEEGCRLFFVATLEEGIELRGVLPQAEIGVFSGIFAGEEQEFTHHRLIPVLNNLEQIELTKGHGILHIDTGMTRLGLSQSDVKKIADRPANYSLVMSHLACANEPNHPKNPEQLARFKEALHYFPGAKVSLANSSGLFLPSEFHFDIGRPGCALYGINPRKPVKHVATLSAPILQIRTLDRDETIGYGASYSVPKGGRIAIIGMGYADGYFRMMSNMGHAYVAGHKVPLAGRVSMDMIALDISALPEHLATMNTRAEFINAHQTVNDLAQQCNTIGYEIFTRIGRRVKRVYS